MGMNGQFQAMTTFLQGKFLQYPSNRRVGGLGVNLFMELFSE
jgi:hypothetical protein